MAVTEEVTGSRRRGGLRRTLKAASRSIRIAIQSSLLMRNNAQPLTGYEPGSSLNMSFHNLVDVLNIIILIIVVDLIL